VRFGRGAAVSKTQVAAGGRVLDRAGLRTPAGVFAGLGVVLVGAGFVVPAAETLLFAWGGTALFLALLFRFVFTGATIPTAVTTDIYTAMAGNARRRAPSSRYQYVPGEEGVSLVVDDESFDPVGERLLATVDTPSGDESVEDRLAVLVDVLVNELELAARATATTTDDGATVTVTGSRVGTTELFDHPVASIVGVALASHLDKPVRLDTSVEDGALVVTCNWS
jgi:hypothetical protein